MVTSHDEGGNINPAYPAELQPRDRSRVASQAWIVDTAANLDPERLMPMPMSGDGAPIVDSDGNVESGNGRVLAIRRAYEQDQAEGYRGFLRGRGIDVDNFRAPVLVQRRTTELPEAERAEYTEESNVPTVAGRSVSEIAAADAARLTVDTLALYRGGPLTHATNREFVRRYVETVVPEATRSELMTADGELSQQGIERIQNAIFAKAYGDTELLGRLREETEGSVRTIGAAMIEAGAEWAAMREAAAEGRIAKGLDITEDLLAAVRLVETARRDHRSLANAVRQTDILKGNALSENGEKLLALMFRDVGVWTQPSGRERLVTGLQKYTGEAMKGAAGRDMFGYEASPGPILEAAYDEQDRVHGAANGTARPAQEEPDDHLSFSAAAREGRPPGMTKADVEAAIAPIVGKWTNRRAPKVTVVQSWTELPLGDKSRAYVEERMAVDDNIAPRGLYRHGKGEVWLVAGELRTANDAREVLAHEAVGHYSVMEMVGQDWGEVVKDVMRLVESGDPQVKPIADQVRRNYGDVDDNTFAAEVIAHMAEKNVRRPVMTRIIGAIRRFLRALGFRLSMSEADVRGMIAQAAGRLEGKRPRRTKAPATARRSQDEGPENPAAQQERFYASLRAQTEARRFYPIDRMFRLLMAPIGGVTENGEWKYAPAIRNAGRKIIREARPNPNGAFAWMDPFIETARSGWLNRYGTPADFVKRERQAATDKARIEAEGIAFVESLVAEDMTADEARALQEILEGEPSTDARLKRLAAPIREAIDNYGKELVELGLLDRATFEKNKGAWLHRSYQRYETDAPALARWGRGIMKKRRQALIGDELKVRGKVHKIPKLKERIMKDVPDALRKTAAKSKTWRIYDRSRGQSGVERVYWPSNLALPARRSFHKGGEWVDRGEWDLLEGRGRRPILRQDYSKAELEEMGEIRDARFNILKSFRLLAHDIAQGRLFEDMTQHPEWYSAERPDDLIIDQREAGEVSPYIGVGWVKVPDTLIGKSTVKRWGAIAGGYVRACIWRDMVELNKMQNPGTWAWLLREYKLSKTARSPGVHFNNTMSNVILADLHDLTVADFVAAVREWSRKGDYYKEAVEHGIFLGGYARVELQNEDIVRALDEALQQTEAEIIKPTIFQTSFNFFKRIDKAARGAYQFEDEIFRLTSYIRDRVQGDLAPDAAANAIDRFLNYDIRAPWPNMLRRSVLPFFSYTYAFVPVMMKAVASRPWKLAKLFTLGYVLNMLAYEITGGDEEQERAVMAPRDKGLTWVALPRMLRMPFTGPNADPMYLDLGRVIPGGGMLETDMGQAGLPEFMLIGGPISMAADLIWNRVAYSGEDLVNNEIDTTLEKAEKRAAYLWRAMMPNLPFLPGTWSWRMMNQAISDERDIFGRQYSIPVAMVRSLGPKLKPQDPEYQHLMRMFDFRRERKELKRVAYQVSSDFRRKRISRERYESEIANYRSRMQDLSRRVAELNRTYRGG